jgi:hypothetical protein
MVKPINKALAMIAAICQLPENRTAIRHNEAQIRSSGLKRTVAVHDTALLAGWLIISDTAAKFDLKAIDLGLLSHQPRLVQIAIWRFCGEGALEICNGGKIDDRKSCGLIDYPAEDRCSRVALFLERREVTDLNYPAVREKDHALKSIHQKRPARSRSQGHGSAARRLHKLGTKRARKTAPVKPLEQGDCDGLCGLYTVINAIRLALHPAGGLSETQKQALKFVLVQAAHANWSFARMFAHGLSTPQLTRMMRIGVKFTREITGKSLRFNDARCLKLTHRRYGLKTVLAKLTRTTNTVVVAGIDGKMNHWSIITRLTAHHIVFHDSDRTHRLALRHCRLSRWPRPKAKPRYWITLHGTVTLSRTE